MEGDGLNLAIGGAALGSLCTVAAAWIKARFGRKVEIDKMPPVAMADKFVTCDQCKAHRDAIDKRFDAQVQLFSKVSDKLDLIEAHNEDRAKRMHDRLDPVIRSAAEALVLMRQHLEDHRAERSAK